MKLVWTRRATRDLRSAYEYWMKEKSEEAADLMLERIFSTVELLRDNPELGREGRIRSTREIALTPLPFLLAYRIGQKRIEILALLHGARKWPLSFQ